MYNGHYNIAISQLQYPVRISILSQHQHAERMMRSAGMGYLL